MQFSPASPKVSFTIGLIMLALAVALSTGYVQAEEIEISTHVTASDCDTFIVRVAYVDVQAQGDPADRRLVVDVDTDGNGSFETELADFTIQDTVAAESDPDVWSEPVDAGDRLRARLFRIEEGPDTLLDTDIEELPEANCVVDDASITVRKDVTGVSNDSTGFFIDFDPGADITGSDGNGIDETDTPTVRGALAAGLYVLTEYDLVTGYEFVSWVCTSDQAGADIHEDKARREVVIALREGEDVSCTVTNRPIPPTPTATVQPTATATSVPPTATPVPTATSVPSVQAPATVAPTNIIVNPPNINVTFPPGVSVAPSQPQQPVASQPSFSGRITPPSTGDAGLASESSCDRCVWIWRDGFYHAHYSYECDCWWYHWHPGGWQYMCEPPCWAVDWRVDEEELLWL